MRRYGKDGLNPFGDGHGHLGKRDGLGVLEGPGTASLFDLHAEAFRHFT